MTGILIRLFVKDHKNISDPRVRRRYGAFAGLAGIVSNLLLFAVKITVGTLFNSIAVTADAVNNLTDCGSSLVALLGFRLSGKPADARHPFGHARIEHISGLIISLIVIILGGQLVYSSVLKIIAPEEVQFSYVLVFALVVSILLKLWQARFYKHIGKKIQSATLVAAGTDSRNDVLSTAAVLAGLLLSRGIGINLDGYLGAIVAVFIVISGLKLVSETSSPLLGTAPDKELVDAIYAKILSYEGILGIHDLAVHNYGGGNIFASVHCEVPSSQDVMVSHEIIDGIERDVKEDLGIDLVVHMDPVDVDDEKTCALRQTVAELLREISPQIGMHDFRVVWGISRTTLIFDVEVPYDFPMADGELLDEIQARLKALNPGYRGIITVDHDYVPRLPEQREKEGEKQ
ncbi:MAG TPA: cation diffusion facilitator family transporter [Bacillota bacterium]|nr:cation diffusion facilitator family transporter [Bacillota bacterium]HQE02273.1 cation diffusion facilitator family transporter [Bacillota bacterium]